MALSFSASTQKKIGIGLIVVGVAAAGYAFYKHNKQKSVSGLGRVARDKKGRFISGKKKKETQKKFDMLNLK